MLSTFLAIGECMVEMAPTADGTFMMGFAGDTLNTAWYVRKSLGRDWAVAYYTGVGTDQVSGQMIDFLGQAGIETGHIRKLQDRTVGLYMIQLRDGERSFAYWRSQSAARCLADDPAALSVAMDTAGLIYFSGITLAILSPEGRQAFFKALKSARLKGAKAAFDPNLRPRLWEDAETMRTCVTEAAGLCDFVMPSFEDEEAYFGDKTPSVSADRYLAAGAQMTVVKNGPQEVIVATETERTAFSPALVKNVVDTTAAGDSFNAGFLAEYLVSGNVDVSVAAGARLAGTVIQHRGALVDCFEPA